MALDLFTHAQEAERRRDDGMARAAQAQDRAHPHFRDLAYAALVDLARRQPTVHVDDFLRFFPLRPDRPNSMGSIWQRAIRRGVIKHSGRVRACTVDAKKHAHLSPEYTSLIYQPGA